MADFFEFATLEPPVRLVAERRSADEQIEAALEQARLEGHAAGYAAGLAEARAGAASAIEAVLAAADQVRASEVAFLERAERSAVALALQAAAKVVGAELAARPELVLEVVSGALRRATERDRLVVEVSPDDFELVRDAADELAGRLGGIRRMEVVAERRVSRGGCVVRTPEGEIDSQISEQLDKLAQVLEQAQRGAGDDA